MKYNLLFCFVSLFLFLACSDVIEEDLKKETVHLQSPNDNLTTTYSTQTYIWSKLEGADSYHIQIVNGTFEQINFFVLDSSLVGNQFVFNLSPGSYQWRVKAQNSVSETPYSTRSIQIDSTHDLTGTSIIQISPVNNLFTNKISIDFTWQTLYNVDNYIFELRENSTTGALIYSDTILQPIIPKGTINLTEGQFSWRVKGVNSTSFTAFSNLTFTADFTAPSTPTIPANLDSIQSRTFTLSWQRNSSDVVYDSLLIYGDIGLSDIKKNVATSTSYTDSLSTGIYYWRVKSIDRANNESGFTNVHRLEIQP